MSSSELHDEDVEEVSSSTRRSRISLFVNPSFEFESVQDSLTILLPSSRRSSNKSCRLTSVVALVSLLLEQEDEDDDEEEEEEEEDES